MISPRNTNLCLPGPLESLVGLGKAPTQTDKIIRLQGADLYSLETLRDIGHADDHHWIKEKNCLVQSLGVHHALH